MKSERFDTIVIPDSLSQRVRKGIRQGEKIYMRNRRKRAVMRIAAAAAALLICMGIFASQPALASKVPVIRNIFKFLQKDYSYQGDLDAVAQKFEEPGKADGGSNTGESQKADSGNHAEDGRGTESGDNVGSGEDGAPDGNLQPGSASESGRSGAGTGETGAADTAYTKTANGVTVSVSEAYCSVEAIYLSFMITSEEDFPETMMDMDGKPVVYLRGTADYSFVPSRGGEAQGYANGGTGSMEGTFIDEHTYAGIYRIDALDIFGNDVELRESYRTLEAFDMDYTIEQIIGDLAEPEPLDYRGKTQADLEAMTDEEWRAFMDEITPPDRNQFPNKYENWWFDGPFTFKLHIEMDNDNTQVVTVDEVNDTGAGLYQVVKTKFEITVEEKCKEERAEKGVFVVVLDADGRLLPNGGSSFADTYAIGGRDVSKVYVYVCDYMEYMDDIKGYRNDGNFRQILEERALYKKEVVF